MFVFFQLIEENYLTWLTLIIPVLIIYKFYLKHAQTTFSKANHGDRTQNNSYELLNGWTVILESDQLKSNQIKALTVNETDLVVYRGTSNKCFVFDAYCPHLGANLGVGGTVVGDSIECPFHGWQFDNNGNCAHIPGIENPTKVQLKKYKVIEILGFICIWFHSEGKEPNWFPQDYFQIEEKGLLHLATTTGSFNSNSVDMLQHFSDFQHYPWLHSDHKIWNNWSKDSMIYRLFHKIIEIKFPSSSWRAGEGSDKHTFSHHMTTLVKIFGSIEIIFKNDVFCMGPSLYTMRTEFNFFGPRHIFSAVGIIPVQNNLCQTICRASSGSGPLNNFWAKHFADSAHKMMKGEAEILENKTYLVQPLLTKNDEPLKQFLKWIKQFQK